MAALLHWLLGLLLFIFGDLFALDLLLAKLHAVPLEVPLLVGLGVDLHDRVLSQGLGSNQLVAGRIVDNIHKTNFPRAILRTPGEIAVVDPQSPVFPVAAAASNRADALLAELAQGC